MKVPAAVGLIHILQAEGVPWLCTFPTGPVNNAAGEVGFPLLMMREERYAVAVADALGRITSGGTIGACTVMGGMTPAGLQMAYGALAQAYEDSAPLLCIVEGVPVGSQGVGRFDADAGFHSVTKWIGHINEAQSVPQVMRRAFTYLRSGRPAPVLVVLARNTGDYDEDLYPYTPVARLRSGPDPSAVTAAVRAIIAAKRPLIMAGEGVLYAQASAELVALAEMAQMPVVTSLKGKSAFPENHPLSLGVRGEMAVSFLRKADLVLAIGSSLIPGGFSHAIPDALHKTLIMCNVDDLDINRCYRTDHALIGDAQLTLRALSAEWSVQSRGKQATRPGLAAEIGQVRAEFTAKYQPLLTSNDTPINPYRIIGDLMKVLDPHSSFVTADSGNTRDQASTAYQAVDPRSFLGWGRVTSLGFGLAAAMAAKLANPQWQCVNITGDAGVGYMMGTFEALVRHGIGVTTLHFNNGGFSGYGPGFWGAGHSPYTAKLSDHAVANMSEAVKALGYYAEDVAEPAEIIPALQRAFAANAAGRPAYVEFLTCQYPVYGAWAT
jgi:acetolactate synthase I/II/III large subunit